MDIYTPDNGTEYISVETSSLAGAAIQPSFSVILPQSIYLSIYVCL